jgi:hypothetical protein
VQPVELIHESGADESVLTPYARLLAAHVVKSHEKGCKLNVCLYFYNCFCSHFIVKAIREKYSTSRFVNNLIVNLEILQHIVDNTISTFNK